MSQEFANLRGHWGQPRLVPSGKFIIVFDEKDHMMAFVDFRSNRRTYVCAIVMNRFH